MLLRLLLFALSSAAAFAAVTRIQVLERTDVLESASAGPAGPYERIVAKAEFAVDPKLAANRIISDIDLAPRNEAGLVEFSADLYVLKPWDPAKGNGVVLFEVSNRGGKGMVSTFNLASASTDPRTPEHFGDRFLLAQGYTLVWLGWQADVPREPGRMRLYAPVATASGRPITGLVRAEWSLDKPAELLSLADRSHIPYPVLDPKDPALRLTVRDRVDAPRREVPRPRWDFEGAGAVRLRGGAEPGKLYELVYRSKDPLLVGLGPAAVRDLISFFKYGGAGTVFADQRRHIRHALAFGVSQSGRFLRTFLYYGFNQDEKGRRVFDGVWAHVAGGGRGSFNHRFAQPSRDGHPHLNTLYPTDIYPFTDGAQRDEETGLEEGLLDRARKAGVVPKIFYSNSSYEYWGRAASLIHTTLDGTRDFPPAPETRIYHIAGSQHGPGNWPPQRGNTQNLRNVNDFKPILRALLAAFTAWLREGTEPPPSRYPSIDRGELVPIDQFRFPKLPGVAAPKRMQRAWRVDYGPQFRSAGIVTIEPPRVGKPFGMRVPQVDGDGNELSGVKMPGVAVPLGIHTGWNLRAPSIGAPEELYSMAGSWIPFPLPKIHQLYRGREDYLEKVRQAGQALVKERYLLEADLPRILKQAEAQWDDLMR